MNYGAFLSKAFTDKLKAVFGITLWQRKAVTTVDTSTGQVGQLTFNNLEIGKTYRVSGLIRGQIAAGSTGSVTFNWIGAQDGTLNLGFIRSDSGSFNLHIGQGVGLVFVANATTAFVNVNSSSSTQVQVGSNLTLEELPNHTETTQWT